MNAAQIKNILFSPISLGSLTIKNRLVKAPQWLFFAEPDGSVGERIKAHYGALAAGGAGLIIVEETVCDFPLGASNVPHLRLDDDSFLPGMRDLADCIHRHQVPAFVQITHAGPAHDTHISGQKPIAPSSLDPPAEAPFAKARELTIDEIEALIEKFAKTAFRIKQAGFDGCEFHMAHYALGNSFLSRYQNRRTDRYGYRDIEDRARFGVQIIQRARELCDRDFVIGVRISAKEWGVPEGTTSEEAAAFAKLFEKAGADYIQASAYGYHAFSFCWAPEQLLWPQVTEETEEFVKQIPEGALLPETSIIKQAVSIPVIGVGRLSWTTGAKAVAAGQIDLVSIGRRMLADPTLPQKVHHGQFEDIRPCTACMHCLGKLLNNQRVECRWNAFLGYEHVWGNGYDFQPATQKKNVLIVGGGPAGLEACRVAALRGHRVKLYEKTNHWGGKNMPLSGRLRWNEELDNIKPILKWYETQLKKLKNVEIYHNVTVDAALIEKEQPEAVILAVGGNLVIPPIDGYKRSNVVGIHPSLIGILYSNPYSVLSAANSYIIVGGNLIALEIAEFLIKLGLQVTIVEHNEQLGEGLNLFYKIKIEQWLAMQHITVHSGVKYEKIVDEGLWITNQAGERQLIEGERILLIRQNKANRTLYKELEGKFPELYLIGDAKADHLTWFAGAVRDGAEAGLKL